jgi:putative phage-type endonuclease
MIEQRSPEWHNQRKNRCTASVAAAILGYAPYMTRADAMRAMVRASLGAETEFQGNVATEHGTFHEAGAIAEFQMESGLQVSPAPFVPFEDWLGASPDGYTSDGGLAEVKCPFGLRKQESPIFKSAAEQPHYLAQMQVQMYCTDTAHCWFFQWTPHGTRTEKVGRDDVWLAQNIPALRQFHAEFIEELANNSADHLAPKRLVINGPEAESLAEKWDEINAQLEKLAALKKAVLANMVTLAGEKNADIAGKKLTFTERKGAVSWAKVAAKHCPGADLKPFTGKSTSFWGVR